MNPSFKLMVQALRSHKSNDDALDIYCQTRCVVPIESDDVILNGIPPHLAGGGFSVYSAVDALRKAVEDRVPDEELEKIFHTACNPRVMWRGMRHNERWTARDLYDQMQQDDKDTLLNLVGVAAVARLAYGAA